MTAGVALNVRNVVACMRFGIPGNRIFVKHTDDLGHGSPPQASRGRHPSDSTPPSPSAACRMPDAGWTLENDGDADAVGGGYSGGTGWNGAYGESAGAGQVIAGCAGSMMPVHQVSRQRRYHRMPAVRDSLTSHDSKVLLFADPLPWGLLAPIRSELTSIPQVGCWTLWTGSAPDGRNATIAHQAVARRQVGPLSPPADDSKTCGSRRCRPECRQLRELSMFCHPVVGH